MAISALVRLSEDKLTRHEYLRRQDDIMLRNKKERDYALMEQHVKQANQKMEQANQRATQAESEIEKLRQEIEELRAGATANF